MIYFVDVNSFVVASSNYDTASTLLNVKQEEENFYSSPIENMVVSIISIHGYRCRIKCAWIIKNILELFWCKKILKGSDNLFKKGYCYMTNLEAYQVCLTWSIIGKGWRISNMAYLYLETSSPITINTKPRHETNFYTPIHSAFTRGVPEWR